MYVYCAVNGTLLGCVIFYVICVFYHLVVLVRLSVPVQVIDWKDSSPKWHIMCWWGRWTLLTHSLTHPLAFYVEFMWTGFKMAYHSSQPNDKCIHSKIGIFHFQYVVITASN